MTVTMVNVGICAHCGEPDDLFWSYGELLCDPCSAANMRPVRVRFTDRYGDHVYEIGAGRPSETFAEAATELPILIPAPAPATPPRRGEPVVLLCDRIVCTGRELDTDDRPTGKPCGRRWHTNCGGCYTPYERLEYATTLEVASARAAGWRVGPADSRGVHNAMCPRCAAPSPTLTRLCNDLGSPDQLDLFPADGD